MKILITILCAITLLSVQPSVAKIVSGNEGAYGGDDVGLEFKTLALLGFKEIANDHPDIAKMFSVTEAINVLDQAAVLGVDDNLELDVNGTRQQVVAINYPNSNKILIQADRWKAIKSFKAKQGLAIHEVLSLMGLETTGSYPISSRFFGTDPQLVVWGSCFLSRSKDADIATSDLEFKTLYSAGAVTFLLIAHSDWMKEVMQIFAMSMGLSQVSDLTSIKYYQRYDQPHKCNFREPNIACEDTMKLPGLTFIFADGQQAAFETTSKDIRLKQNKAAGFIDLVLNATVLATDADQLVEPQSLGLRFNKLICR